MNQQARNRHFTSEPYDDQPGYLRLWGGLSDAELSAAARSDPLGFAADHIDIEDREGGAVAVILDDGKAPLTSLIVGGPLDPSPKDCRRALSPFAMAAGRAGLPNDPLSIGVVHHRGGPAEVTDLDIRWLEAVTATAKVHGIMVSGVIARTEAGALVRVA
ncbi:MAG: hypothetical protein WCP28_01735 [Actinomycetes bacterium]